MSELDVAVAPELFLWCVCFFFFPHLWNCFRERQLLEMTSPFGFNEIGALRRSFHGKFARGSIGKISCYLVLPILQIYFFFTPSQRHVARWTVSSKLRKRNLFLSLVEEYENWSPIQQVLQRCVRTSTCGTLLLEGVMIFFKAHSWFWMGRWSDS